MTGHSKIQPNEYSTSADQDWMLQSIVHVTNGLDVEFPIPITISVGGILISGKLISGKNFFALISKEIAEDMKDEGVLASHIEALLGPYAKVYGAEDDDYHYEGLPNYIHLSDARFYHNSGQPIPTNRGISWRGRIAAVDGFVFGSIKISEKTAQ